MAVETGLAGLLGIALGALGAWLLVAGRLARLRAERDAERATEAIQLQSTEWRMLQLQEQLSRAREALREADAAWRQGETPVILAQRILALEEGLRGQGKEIAGLYSALEEQEDRLAGIGERLAERKDG